MSDYICPHNCAYRTNAGHCGMTGGYESCQYIKYLEKLEKEKTNIKPFAGKRTNADRIRAMTDEELAEYLVPCACPPIRFNKNTGDIVCPANKEPSVSDCKSCWIDWLQEEGE